MSVNDLAKNEGARDSASLRLLGAFFCFLGVLVFVGAWWALDKPRAAVVSVASSVALVAVGVFMHVAARRISQRREPSEHSPESSA